MIRRALSFALLAAAIVLASPPQPASATPPYHYFYRGVATPLELDPAQVAVRLRAGGSPAGNAMRAWSAAADAAVEPTGAPGWLRLDAGTPASARDAAGAGDASAGDRVRAGLRRVLAQPEVEFASPVFRLAGGGWAAVTPHLLVRLRDGEERSRVFAGIAGEALVEDEAFGGIPGACRLRCASRDGFDVLALANRLAGDPRVAWAEPDMWFTGWTMIESVSGASTLPAGGALGDPLLPDQWAIANTGQFGGVPGVDLDADLAWAIETGRPEVKVLVLDVGVQQSHPDLNLVPGADFTNEGFRGDAIVACDNHGTAVAGCVAGVRDNGIGIAGVAPGCPVLSARIGVSSPTCGQGWSGPISATVYALAWGFVNGARVSNNSNGYGFSANAIDDAYASTRDGGMVHFASAGNGGQQPLGYPASIPAVLAVGSIAPTGQLSVFTNHGPDIELMAPGESIWTTDRTGPAGYVSGDHVLAGGTSFSSPCAAAVAALLVSQDPARSAAVVENLLFQGCADYGAPGRDDVYGYGIVNAYNSLTLAPGPAVGVEGRPAGVAFAARPNPFSRACELAFTLERAGVVALDIHDLAGRTVRSLRAGALPAGRHAVAWDGRGNGGEELAPGLYFARLFADGSTAIRRLVLSR